jgi:hypothetical protein
MLTDSWLKGELLMDEYVVPTVLATYDAAFLYASASGFASDAFGCATNG